jgi:hypothetical protein
VSAQLIRPLHAQRLDIRCNVGDVVLSNVANHLVFFFERHLDISVAATRKYPGELLRAVRLYRESEPGPVIRRHRRLTQSRANHPTWVEPLGRGVANLGLPNQT